MIFYQRKQQLKQLKHNYIQDYFSKITELVLYSEHNTKIVNTLSQKTHYTNLSNKIIKHRTFQ